MARHVASSDVWPLGRTEPSIEGVIVAAIGLAFYFDGFFVDSRVVNPIFRVVDVDESRNWDAPRNLAGDVPVAEILEVVDEHLFLVGWVEFNFARL